MQSQKGKKEGRKEKRIKTIFFFNCEHKTHNFRFLIRCCFFLTCFIGVMPLMPLLFLAFFILSARSDVCRLMYQRSKPVPANFSSTFRYDVVLECISNWCIYVHFLTLLYGLQLTDGIPFLHSDHGDEVDESMPVSEQPVPEEDADVSKYSIFKPLVDIATSSVDGKNIVIVILVSCWVVSFLRRIFEMFVPEIPADVKLHRQYLRRQARVSMLNATRRKVKSS